MLLPESIIEYVKIFLSCIHGEESLYLRNAERRLQGAKYQKISQVRPVVALLDGLGHEFFADIIIDCRCCNDVV